MSNDAKEPRWPGWLPLRSELRDRTPYGAPQVEADARLNTNENPYPIPAEVTKALEAAIAKEITSLNRYPDRDVMRLRDALARYIHDFIESDLKVTSRNIWPANGSNEVLQSILLAFDGKVGGFSPSYSMHPILTLATGRTFTSCTLGANFEVDMKSAQEFIAAEKPKLFLITSPNNPTGRSISIEEIRNLAVKVAEVGGITIVDEAYGEFSTQKSAISLLDEIAPLIVVRTMSKAFAFAGARIGYAVAREESIDALQLVRLPYHLSAITQAAGIAALGHAPALLESVTKIKSDRDLIARELVSLGFHVIPSDANFILFGGFTSVPSIAGWGSDQLWRELLDRGILIRDVGIPGFLRVTVGLENENRLFLQVLRQVMGK